VTETIKKPSTPPAQITTHLGRLVVLYSPGNRKPERSAPMPGPGGLLLLGRDADRGLGLCAHDPHASRLHARLAWDLGGATHRLTDADSANGTFVQGERIDSKLLCPGDVLRIGDTLLWCDPRPPDSLTNDKVERTARSELSVLIQGETGSGKELLANEIHAKSGRTGPLLAINCATLSRELIMAELFGHTRGAFSGAERARSGLFVAAHDGTLFLDEVGDLPLELQPALLRALEEGKVRPVGSDTTVPAKPRILAASHVDLRAAVETGCFRADLLARLAQVTLPVLPLRATKDRILPLLEHFVAEAGGSLEITTDAAEALFLWPFPENVRELRTLARTSVVLRGPHVILDVAALAGTNPRLVRRGSFNPSLAPDPAGGDAAAAPVAAGAKREALRDLLSRHDGNISAVAQQLGKSRSYVYRWMKNFGLNPDEG